MKRGIWVCMGIAAAIVALGAFAAKPEASTIGDWRSWQHVKGMAILDKNHGLYGFHHVYVEPKALAAYKEGKGYRNGVTIAVPFYEVQEGSGTVSQGPLMKVAFMKRDSKATETGGWIFGAVDASGKSLPVDGKACFQCHVPRQNREYVFSEWAE